MSWRNVTLNKICTTQYGYTASATEAPVGPKFLRITDIVSDSIDWETVPHCKIDVNLIDKYKLYPGDIVIARTGNTTGYAKLIREQVEAVFASYLVRLKINQDSADANFLGRVLESKIYKDFVKSIKGGAAQGNANAKTLTLFKLRLPPINVQQKIVSILSAYDNLIENNRRRIHLLEESARLLYKEWFVHLRFPGHEHVKIIDGVPEGWEIRKIADIAETVGGGTPSTKVPEYWIDGNIVWFVPSDVTSNNGLSLLDSEKKISETGFKKSSAKMLPPETILMTSRASIGYFGLFEKECCTNQGFISLIPRFNDTRMYMLFNLMNRNEEIILRAGGTTYKEINKSTFRNMDMLMPSKSLLIEFENYVYAFIKQSRSLKKQIKALTQARDILLPHLMNGEIAV
jgi:type I restriction enzyme S subunit